MLKSYITRALLCSFKVTMGYGLFSFITSYPIKTEIPFYLVEELVADGQLLVVLLLLRDSHVLKTLLSLGSGGWGGDFDSFHA